MAAVDTDAARGGPGRYPGPEPEDLLARVQELSERAERLDDPRARELAAELVSAVIAMYGDGLERIIAVVEASREAGATILDQLAQDPAVASLLLIHDLYPVSLHDRVIEALDTVRPYMESHGGNVELMSLEDGVARLQLQGSCHGCNASRATLETAITQALNEHCPDLAGIEVDGVVDSVSSVTGMALPMAEGELSAAAASLPTGGIQLPIVQAGGAGPVVLGGMSDPAPAPPTWTELDDAARPSPGALRPLSVGGRRVVLADVAGTLLAYADECAACGEPLHDGVLDVTGLLSCPHCAAEFDLPHAGRAVGGEPLQLRPLPLLDNGPALRVAV